MADVEEVAALSLAVLLLWRVHQDKHKKKRLTRRCWVKKLFKERETHGYSAQLLPLLQNEEVGMYSNFLRMSPVLFEELLQKTAPLMTKKTTTFCDPISAQTRLQITLRFLAAGEDFRSLQYQFRVGETTVGKIVRECCAAIWKTLAPEYHLKFPQTQHEWLQFEAGFSNKWQLPHCMGAMDGKHVRMQKPNRTESLNYNYKKYFSKVLFAVVDANYKFVYVDIGSYGSEGDSGILNKSQFGKTLFQNRLNLPPPSLLPNSPLKFPHFFIGDQAFPLRTDLLRPYKGQSIQNSQKIFNYRLCRARRVVENAFGILANRFRVFRHELHASEKTNDNVVMAALALHNFLLHKKCSQYCPPMFTDRESGNNHHLPVDGIWRVDSTPVNGLTVLCRQGSTNSPRLATRNRDVLANYFNTVGSVPWQHTAILNGYYT